MLVGLSTSGGCALAGRWLPAPAVQGTAGRTPTIVSLTDEAASLHSAESEEGNVVYCAAVGEPAPAIREPSKRPIEAEPRPLRSVLRIAQAPAAQRAPEEAAPMPSARELLAPPVVVQPDITEPGEPRELPSGEQPALQSTEPVDDNDFKPLTQITTSIAPPPASADLNASDLMPTDYAAAAFARYGRAQYRSESYTPWQAYTSPQITQTFCHRPLYFEEINVERYGYSAGILQPAVSGLRFFGTIPLLPYKMALDRPAQCRVDPSPYPPGVNAPRHRQAPPLRIVPTLVEAAAVVGIIALIP